MHQRTCPSAQSFQFRTTHAVVRHIALGNEVLLYIDDIHGREIRSDLVSANVLTCSKLGQFTGQLITRPMAFPELQQGSIIYFQLEHVLRVD